MHVRPFFWFLLAISCIGVLIFAATEHVRATAIMQVHLSQYSPVSGKFTTLDMHLTDTEGLPIEQARVYPNARMTNMDMVSNQSSIRALGQGIYRVHLYLYMAGPWEINIAAQAEGFDTLHHTFLVQVQ